MNAPQTPREPAVAGSSASGLFGLWLGFICAFSGSAITSMIWERLTIGVCVWLPISYLGVWLVANAAFWVVIKPNEKLSDRHD